MKIIFKYLILTKERIITQETLNRPIKQEEAIVKDIFFLGIQSLNLILFCFLSFAELSLN